MADSTYQQGFDGGFADGKSHKTKRPKPAFIKSLLSTKYLEQYSNGYKAGYYAGVREVRQQELKRIHASQPKSQTRER